MDIQVRGLRAPPPEPSNSGRVVRVLCAAFVIGLLVGVMRRHSHRPRPATAPAAPAEGRPATVSAPREAAVAAPTAPAEPAAAATPASIPAPAQDPSLRVRPSRTAAAEPSGLDMLSGGSGALMAPQTPSRPASSQAARPLDAAAEARGATTAFSPAKPPRGAAEVGQRVSAAAATARSSRQGFGPKAARFTAMPPSAAPRVSSSWPTLAQMSQSILDDAATYARIAPPIKPDGSAFAMGGLTNLAVGPGQQQAQSAAGSSGRSSVGGSAGGSQVMANAPSANAADDGNETLPSPGASPIPWRAGANDTGMIYPDISIWRIPKDWDALDKASKGIVCMKVRQASIDKAFSKGLDEAQKRKMIVIGYAFGYGTVSGAAQADALLLNFPLKPGRILMLDLERNPYGSSMSNEQAIDFVERIKARTGSYPVLYTSASHARPGALAKCGRYVAQWGSQPRDVDLWQFTDGVVGPGPHSFPGVGSCDINKVIMPYGRLRRWAGLDLVAAR